MEDLHKRTRPNHLWLDMLGELNMSKGKQRQALALQSHLSSFDQRAIVALEAEAARIVEEDAGQRMNGGTNLHIVSHGGVLSGFVKDAHTTIQFQGGSVAVTTHD